MTHRTALRGGILSDPWEVICEGCGWNRQETKEIGQRELLQMGISHERKYNGRRNIGSASKEPGGENV